MKRIPINSPFGELYGRDKIYLDNIIIKYGTSTIILEGAITEYAERNEDIKWKKYKLTFNGVLATKMVKLDSSDHNWTSSFDEIIDSDWISSLGGKVTPQHRHIFIQTYDHVFDIVCESFEMINMEIWPNQSLHRSP